MFTIKSYLYALYFACLVLNVCQLIPVTLVSEQALVGQVYVLQDLKQRIEQQKIQISPPKATKTPTLSYIQAAKNGHLDKYYLDWLATKPKNAVYQEILKLQSKYKDLVDSVIEHEQEYCNDYYVFYHGQRSKFWVFQEFLKELHSLIKIHSPLGQFEFVRMWQEATDRYQVNNFIDAEEAKLSTSGNSALIWNDTKPDLIKNMLCVNLSLFGNLTYSGESSFAYFLDNSNASWTPIENLLKRLFDYYGFDKKFINQLIASDTLLDHKNGILMQIFVPKNQINKFVYLSKSYGTPVREKLDVTWNPNKKRHLNISALLEKYINEPHLMGNFDQLQARILLSKESMLNPDSGIKVFKHSTEDKTKLDAYKKVIKNIAKQVFVDALKQKTFKNIASSPLEKLINYSKVH